MESEAEVGLCKDIKKQVELLIDHQEILKCASCFYLFPFGYILVYKQKAPKIYFWLNEISKTTAYLQKKWIDLVLRKGTVSSIMKNDKST